MNSPELSFWLSLSLQAVLPLIFSAAWAKTSSIAPAVVQIPTAEVLVAKSDIGLGETIAPENLQWQTWTDPTASGSFIRKKDRPDAVTQPAGSIVRTLFIAGEPIREQKLVKANGAGSYGSNPAERDASGFD